MMSIVKLLVASNRIVFGASFARSLLKMLSQDPHNAKVHEAIVYIADAYVNLGEYATAYSMYMRLNLVMTGKEKYQALTCILVIKINYCAERLEPEPAKEVTEFQSLSKKEIAQHLGKFKTINEQFHKRNHTVSADILRQCNPHELLQANQVYYSYYGNQAKARGYSTLGMESGNGGFDPYPGLSGAIQDFDHMHSYQYSQPSDKMVETMGSYLRDKKIVRSDIPIRDKNILAGNGTTQLYSIVLAKLLGDRPRTAGKDIILVPSPSYGLFVPQIYALGGEVKTVPLLKSNNYKLTALQLSHAIQATNEELFVKSRIELTSHYNIFLQKAKDLGLDTQRLPIYIGETATTREAIDANLGEITQSTLRLVDDVPVLRAKLSAFGRFSLPLPPEVPRVVGLFFCNIHNPTGKAYNQQEVDSIDQVRRDHHVTVIEDLTHHELKFNKKLQLGYFANRQGIIPYKQATLMGISKNLCAAAWRVGVAYLSDDFNFSAEDASRDDKQRYNYMGITDRLFSQSVFLTPFQRAAILIAFDAKDVARERYVDERNYIYLFRSELFTAFIQGINTITNPVFAIDMINYVKASGSDRALALLISGIPELSIFTVPEGSFFLLIDFSKLINKYVGHLKLETVCEIYQALCSTVNIEAITAEGMLSPDLAIMRFTLGVGRAKIVDCAVRLALFVSLVTAEPTEDLSNVIVVDDKVKQDDLIPQSVNVAPSDAASCASASSSSPSTSDSNSANLLAVVSQVRRQQSIFAQMSAASQPIVEQGASSNQNRTATHLTFWSAPEKKSASVVAVSESAPRPH
jgi:aspartate/methionine/tyrosine aminotransferase